MTNRSADIELYLPENSGFEITANARSGEIESDFSGPDLAAPRREGSAMVMNGTVGARRTASISLTTSHGTIRLQRVGGGKSSTD